MRGHQVVGCAWNDVQATVGNLVPAGIEHVEKQFIRINQVVPEHGKGGCGNHDTSFKCHAVAALLNALTTMSALA